MILTNANVFNGIGGFLPGLNVIVDGTLIQSVTAELHPATAEDHQLLDCTGKFLTPGLVDAHTHIDWSDPGVTEPELRRIEFDYSMMSFLFHGVTTVINMSAHAPQSVIAVRNQTNLYPRALVPRIFTGAFHFTVPGGWGSRHGGALESFEEIEPRIAADKAAGADLIKIIDEDGLDHSGRLPKITREAMRRIVASATAHELPVFVHATGLDSYEDCVLIRPHTIAHGLLDDPADAGSDLLARLAHLAMPIVPTITVFELLMNPASWPPDNDKLYEASVPDFVRELRRSPERAEELAKSQRKHGVAFWNEGALDNVKANTRRFAEAGIPLAAGTDRGEGYFLPWELELMSREIGPVAALVAGTSGGAQAIGRSDEFGTIAAGMSADILILNSNPLDNIRNVRDFDTLLVRGHLLDRGSLSYASFAAQQDILEVS